MKLNEKQATALINVLLQTPIGECALAEAGLFNILTENERWDTISKYGHDDILIEHGCWKECRTETLVINEKWNIILDRYPNCKNEKWFIQYLIQHKKWEFLAECKAWYTLAAYHQYNLLAQHQQWNILAQHGQTQILVENEQWDVLAKEHRWNELRNAGKTEYIPEEFR